MSIDCERRATGCRIDTFTRRNGEFVVLENERVRTEVWLTKGADILELRYKPADLNVLWRGDRELYDSGSYVAPASGGGAFIDYFTAGWQEVFPNGGVPCEFAGAHLGQHGEVALLPWRCAVLRDDPACVEVEFSVRTHRTPFSLVRRMRLDAGGAKLVLDETITNLGGQPLPFMWGHHPGFGPPFLEPGCEIAVAGGTIAVPHRPARPGARLVSGARSGWPVATTADGGEVDLGVFPGLDTHCDDDFCVEDVEAGWVTLRNPRLGLTVRMDWNTEVFPHLWCWYVAAGSADHPFYGGLTQLALEPFSSPIGSLVENVERGSVQTLDAGASISSTLSIAFAEDALC
jgi:galactose mutarotase-like enzyme